MSIKTHTIVVLSDGQTWNTLNGCSILVINDQQFDDLCNDRVDAGDLMPLAEIGMADVTPPTDSDIAFEDDNEYEAWDHGGALGQFEREEGENN